MVEAIPHNKKESELDQLTLEFVKDMQLELTPTIIFETQKDFPADEDGDKLACK